MYCIVLCLTISKQTKNSLNTSAQQRGLKNSLYAKPNWGTSTAFELFRERVLCMYAALCWQGSRWGFQAGSLLPDKQEPTQMPINWSEKKELVVTDVLCLLLPGTPFHTVPKACFFKIRVSGDSTYNKRQETNATKWNIQLPLDTPVGFMLTAGQGKKNRRTRSTKPCRPIIWEGKIIPR